MHLLDNAVTVSMIVSEILIDRHDFQLSYNQILLIRVALSFKIIKLKCPNCYGQNNDCVPFYKCTYCETSWIFMLFNGIKSIFFAIDLKFFKLFDLMILQRDWRTKKYFCWFGQLISNLKWNCWHFNKKFTWWLQKSR